MAGKGTILLLLSAVLCTTGLSVILVTPDDCNLHELYIAGICQPVCPIGSFWLDGECTVCESPSTNVFCVLADQFSNDDDMATFLENISPKDVRSSPVLEEQNHLILCKVDMQSVI